MNNEFCTYKQSLALKKLGFDKKCFGWYSQHKDKVTPHIPCSHNTDYNTVTRPWTTDEFECCTAPLKQQAFKFFREKHGSHSHISKYKDNNFYHYDIFVDEVDEDGDECYETYPCNHLYNTYKEAESACLDKLIEIAKNKNDE